MSAPVPTETTIPQAIQLPNGHGRIDCSCGAVIHRCDDDEPAHDIAVRFIHHGCKECWAIFGGLPSDVIAAIKDATPAPERHDEHTITEAATLETIEPAPDAPDAPTEPTEPTTANDQVTAPAV